MVKDLALNPTILIIEIFVVVVLSICFESVEEWFHHRLSRDKMGLALMEVMFKEITLLGFVAFIFWTVLHSGFVSDKWVKAYPLLSALEVVRMLMFMVVNMLIIQAIGLWVGGQRIIREWGAFERARSFGDNKTSLENRLINQGYLKKIPDPTGQRNGILKLNRQWGFGDSFWKRMFRVLSTDKIRKLLILRAIRHEFLFPSVDSTRVPDPSTFSFESYLAKRLGKVLIQMITVDLRTWLSTLALLAVPLYSFKFSVVSWVTWEEAYICAFSWLLVLGGVILIAVLEEDTYRMTPTMPTDLRLTLKIFNGESLQMLRRKSTAAWKAGSISGMRYRPNLGEVEHIRAKELSLGRPLAMRTLSEGGRSRLLNSETYISIARVLSHFQAITAAVLIVVQLMRIVHTRLEWVFYFLSVAAWFFNDWIVLPLVLRRITLISSIEFEKDERAMRVTTLEFKDALLKDFQRLVQLLGFEKRAAVNKEEWTLKDGQWDRKDQIQAVLRGNKLFESLPREDQIQIWAIFAAWDADNSGNADLKEVAEVFKLMEFASADDKTVGNLIRLVDFDKSGLLTWMKFKAIFGVATVKRPKEELTRDLSYWFQLLDTDGSNSLSLDEIAAGFKGMSISLSGVDIGNLLFTFYGMAKPEITKEEFVDFISADNRMAAIRAYYDYSLA